jgi:multisubunit Na+/H+ antiporter MnhE subunit
MVVGILVAWLMRNSGTGTSFLVAFVCAFAAAWLFERLAGQRAEKPAP